MKKKVLGNNLKTYSVRFLMFIPIGSQQLKFANLTGGTNMFAYAGANIIVSDSANPYQIGRIGRQTV